MFAESYRRLLAPEALVLFELVDVAAALSRKEARKVSNTMSAAPRAPGKVMEVRKSALGAFNGSFSCTMTRYFLLFLSPSPQALRLGSELCSHGILPVTGKLKAPAEVGL